MNWGKFFKLLGKGALGVATGGASLALPGVGLQSILGDASAPKGPDLGSGDPGTMIGAEGPGWGGTDSTENPWLRDAASAGGDAIKALLANRAKKKELQLEESRLNPYRGVQQQAGAAGNLDMMANMDFASAPTSIAGRYGDVAGPAASGFTWNPDPQTRGTAAAALALVRGGQGRNPSAAGGPSTAPVANAPAYPPPAMTAPPAPAPLSPMALQLLDRRRRRGGPPNPWLQEDPYAGV